MSLPTDRSLDLEVARAIGRGDASVFEVVYETYFRRIYAYCCRRTGSTAEAERATERILWTAFERLPDYTAEQPLAVWVLGIARRTLAGAAEGELSRRSGKPAFRTAPS